MKGKPWLGLDAVYDEYLESPGTKAYKVEQAKKLFSEFSEIATRVICSSGNLLIGSIGQRHQGALLDLAKKYGREKLYKLYQVIITLASIF